MITKKAFEQLRALLKHQLDNYCFDEIPQAASDASPIFDLLPTLAIKQKTNPLGSSDQFGICNSSIYKINDICIDFS